MYNKFKNLKKNIKKRYSSIILYAGPTILL